MEMHQVRYFLAAAQALSFTRAAELCNVSQPALTTAMKKLETELGSQLFHRDGRRVILTEFGKMMQPHLAEIANQSEVAQDVAKNFRLLNQVPVRLGVMATIGPMLISRFLTAFETTYGGIEVEVHEDRIRQLIDRLDAGEFDLCILNPLDGLGDGFRIEALYSERYFVLLPSEHELRQKNAISLSDLSGQPYVDRLSCEMREKAMAICQSSGVKLYARFRSEREDWIQAMVIAGLGVALMPEHSITNANAIRRPLVDPEITPTIAVVSMPGREFSPGTAALMRTARSYKWIG